MAKKTNLEMFLDSVDRAKETAMSVFEHGGLAEGFIVINGGNKGYLIGMEEGQIASCTCPHHHHRKAICKHMIYVSMEKGLNIKGI